MAGGNIGICDCNGGGVSARMTSRFHLTLVNAEKDENVEVISD